MKEKGNPFLKSYFLFESKEIFFLRFPESSIQTLRPHSTLVFLKQNRPIPISFVVLHSTRKFSLAIRNSLSGRLVNITGSTTVYQFPHLPLRNFGVVSFSHDALLVLLFIYSRLTPVTLVSAREIWETDDGRVLPRDLGQR